MRISSKVEACGRWEISGWVAVTGVKADFVHLTSVASTKLLFGRARLKEIFQGVSDRGVARALSQWGFNEKTGNKSANECCARKR